MSERFSDEQLSADRRRQIIEADAARSGSSLLSGFVEQFDLGSTRAIEVCASIDESSFMIRSLDTIAQLLEFFSRPRVVFPCTGETLAPGWLDLRFAYPNRFGWRHFRVGFDRERALVSRDGFGITISDRLVARLIASPDEKFNERAGSLEVSGALPEHGSSS